MASLPLGLLQRPLQPLSKVHGRADAPVVQEQRARLLDVFRDALEPFKGGSLTKAGRALSKHPEIVGLTKASLRNTIRSDAKLNETAQAALREILDGTRAELSLPRYGEVIEFRGANGFGARFDAESGEFIGFINP